MNGDRWYYKQKRVDNNNNIVSDQSAVDAPSQA